MKGCVNSTTKQTCKMLTPSNQSVTCASQMSGKYDTLAAGD